MKTRIVHFSSVHPGDDTRIRVKECASLAAAGYEVTLIARKPKGTPVTGDVQFIEFPAYQGRLRRMVLGPVRMLRLALANPADIYHFHDPELIPVGLVLKITGKHVVYDVHEDVPAQIMTKSWIPGPLRSVASTGIRLVHKLANRVFDGIVVARSDAAEAFAGENVALVQNYPLLSEFGEVSSSGAARATDPSVVTYVGGITEIRGIREMIAAIAIVSRTHNVVLELAGPFQPAALQQEMETQPGWIHVRYRPWIDRREMADLLATSSVGLLLFLPVPNHVTSYPNKLFEYMAAGLPIVASNFPYWEQFVDEIGSGLRVDPTNPEEIAAAITRLLDDPAAANVMGQRGAAAVQERFSWEPEAERLVTLYQHILGERVQG